jgi:hypothetical protein
MQLPLLLSLLPLERLTVLSRKLVLLASRNQNGTLRSL